LSGWKKPADCCQSLMNKGLCLVADNGHALAMAGQFITFCLNVCPVNEQKVEISILLLNSVFSARNYSPIANKKLMKYTSPQLTPMRCKRQSRVVCQAIDSWKSIFSNRVLKLNARIKPVDLLLDRFLQC